MTLIIKFYAKARCLFRVNEEDWAFSNLITGKVFHKEINLNETWNFYKGACYYQSKQNFKITSYTDLDFSSSTYRHHDDNIMSILRKWLKEGSVRASFCPSYWDFTLEKSLGSVLDWDFGFSYC